MKRWASEVLDAQSQDELELPAEKTPPSIAVRNTPGTSQPLPNTMAACKLIVDRACEGLGSYSDECAEARKTVPKRPSAAWANACSGLVDRYVTLIRAGATGKTVNACRELMILSCEFHGQRSWQCKQTRGQINHLGKTGNREACVGDLLTWHLKRVAERLLEDSLQMMDQPGR